MPTRLYSVVVDAIDFKEQVRWWATALGRPIAGERDDEAWIQLEDGPELLFAPISEPKFVKNRVHLDLVSHSDEEQRAIVNRLLSLGAAHTDIGQGDVPWSVLADPEGNEFCVLEPRDAYADTGAVGAIVVDTHDVRRLTSFWREASGWLVLETQPWGSRLRAGHGRGPYLEPTRMEGTKTVKNRVHLDVAPLMGDDQDAEAHRLVSLGARRIDIGQGQVPWIVMADPENNEFCILTAR
jgi:hypothetical protein